MILHRKSETLERLRLLIDRIEEDWPQPFVEASTSSHHLVESCSLAILELQEIMTTRWVMRLDCIIMVRLFRHALATIRWRPVLVAHFDNRGASLRQDDIDGITFIYPSQGGGPAR